MSVVSTYVKRVSRRNPTLKIIDLYKKQLTNTGLVELVDCLLAHPDVVEHVLLDYNQLTNEMGVKLARYLAVSSTVKTLSLSNNYFDEATYLAITAALHVNSSLQNLDLDENQVVDQTYVNAAFVDALRLNSVRPEKSIWRLYEFFDVEFKRLKNAAEKSTPPSMLEFLLCMHSETELNKLKIH